MKTSSEPQSKPVDPLAGDWGIRGKVAVVLAPLLLALGTYAYCELREPNCDSERNKQSQEHKKASDTKDSADLIDVAYEEYPKTAEDKAVKSDSARKCSGACYIVHKTLEDVVALFTALLAYIVYVQVLLMLSQEKWLRRAYKTSAFANKLSFDTSISTHRPNIRVKHVFLKSDIWQGEKIRIELAIVNTGINTARIVDCNTATLILPHDRELPQIPPFGVGGYVPSYPFLPGGKTYVLPNYWETKKLTDEENAGIRADLMKLYCFGYVDYIDVSGMVLRKTSFCRVLSLPKHPGSYQDMGRFVKLEPENTDYEYQD